MSESFDISGSLFFVKDYYNLLVQGNKMLPGDALSEGKFFLTFLSIASETCGSEY